MVRLYLKGPYRKSIIQQQPGVTTIKSDVSLNCMRMTEPVTGWFGIFGVLKFDLNEVTGGNDEYIDMPN